MDVTSRTLMDAGYFKVAASVSKNDPRRLGELWENKDGWRALIVKDHGIIESLIVDVMDHDKFHDLADEFDLTDGCVGNTAAGLSFAIIVWIAIILVLVGLLTLKGCS